ncbi:MAG: SdpI family protein, partial [Dehalococcoidia bacterium]
LAMGALFLLLGNVMAKIRPNYFAGIRTPWTLASTKSWTATHRRGGWVFMAAGVGFLLMAVVREPWFLWTVMGGLGAGIAWLVVYSWLVWRSDPERVPVTGTTPAASDEEPPAQT